MQRQSLNVACSWGTQVYVGMHFLHTLLLVTQDGITTLIYWLWYQVFQFIKLIVEYCITIDSDKSNYTVVIHLKPESYIGVGWYVYVEMHPNKI